MNTEKSDYDREVGLIRYNPRKIHLNSNITLPLPYRQSSPLLLVRFEPDGQCVVLPSAPQLGLSEILSARVYRSKKL